ncbi:peptidylprolyl isomerase [Cesiribacter sp. SM1]|uniref:peptidylprolyl isomerase n=1 Tax=Cesiribacter sp. SM1 TaxID=2861196 RepID=UPI001CD40A5E|nr:peptidylprolyl isomerase [Cesiribacter sp. SM1]
MKNSCKALLLAVFGLSSLAASAQSAASQPNRQVVDKIVAKVDNYIALRSELDLTYLDLQSREQFGSVNKCDVLRNLVQNKLMLAKAEIDSITVTDAEVNRELERRMQYMVQQLGGEEEIEQYYNKPLSQFKAELRGRMKEQLLVQRMQEHITQDVTVTPAEVRRFFSKIPADSLPYFSTEVTVGHIVKLPVISKEQKAKVREQLEGIRQRILSNEVTFAEMAREFSEDPGSAANGGELGFWKRGELAPQFEATALRMKPGEISAPVETEFGFHIIQLIERRGNTYNSRHILMKPNSSEADIRMAEQYLDSLRTVIESGKISFSKAAKEYSEDKVTQSSGGYFVDADGSQRTSVEDIDPSLYFVIDTMQVGNITKPIPYRTADGKSAVRIVYYKSKVGPHEANLKDDYQKIQAAALNEKKNRIVARWFNEAVGEVFIDIDPEYDYCNIAN